MTMVDEVWGKCINKNLLILINNKKVYFANLKNVRKRLKAAMDNKSDSVDELISEELKARRKYEQCVKRINLLQARNFDYSMLTNDSLSQYGFNITALKGVIDVDTYYGPAKKNVLKIQSELIEEFKSKIRELYKRKNDGEFTEEEVKNIQNELFFTYAHYIKTCPLYKTQDYVKVEEMNNNQDSDDDIIIEINDSNDDEDRIDDTEEVIIPSFEISKEDQDAIDGYNNDIFDQQQNISNIEEDKKKNQDKLNKIKDNVSDFENYYKGNALGRQESKIKLEIEYKKTQNLISANDYAINYANITIEKSNLEINHRSHKITDLDYNQSMNELNNSEELMGNEYEALSCRQSIDCLKLKALLLNEELKLSHITAEEKDEQQEELLEEITNNENDLKDVEDKIIKSKKKRLREQLRTSYKNKEIDKQTLDYNLKVLSSIKDVDEFKIDNSLNELVK